jgi:hypothetical protein
MEAHLRYQRQLGSRVFPKAGPKLTGPKPLRKHKITENGENHPAEAQEEVVVPLSERSAPRINFIQRNIQAAAASKSRQKVQRSVSKKELLVGATHQAGTIPRYVSERKEQMEKETNTPREAHPPPGMRLLSEDEKTAAMSNLGAQKDEIEQTLARAPLVIESQTLLRKHRQMEEQLKELDHSVDQLKRKYVFVPE